jgi:hypothetical protein
LHWFVGKKERNKQKNFIRIPFPPSFFFFFHFISILVVMLTLLKAAVDYAEEQKRLLVRGERINPSSSISTEKREQPVGFGELNKKPISFSKSDLSQLDSFVSEPPKAIRPRRSNFESLEPVVTPKIEFGVNGGKQTLSVGSKLPIKESSSMNLFETITTYGIENAPKLKQQSFKQVIFAEDIKSPTVEEKKIATTVPAATPTPIPTKTNPPSSQTLSQQERAAFLDALKGVAENKPPLAQVSELAMLLVDIISILREDIPSNVFNNTFSDNAVGTGTIALLKSVGGSAETDLKIIEFFQHVFMSIVDGNNPSVLKAVSKLISEQYFLTLQDLIILPIGRWQKDPKITEAVIKLLKILKRFDIQGTSGSFLEYVVRFLERYHFDKVVQLFKTEGLVVESKETKVASPSPPKKEKEKPFSFGSEIGEQTPPVSKGKEKVYDLELPTTDPVKKEKEYIFSFDQPEDPLPPKPTTLSKTKPPEVTVEVAPKPEAPKPSMTATLKPEPPKPSVAATPKPRPQKPSSERWAEVLRSESAKAEPIEKAVEGRIAKKYNGDLDSYQRLADQLGVDKSHNRGDQLANIKLFFLKKVNNGEDPWKITLPEIKPKIKSEIERLNEELEEMAKLHEDELSYGNGSEDFDFSIRQRIIQIRNNLKELLEKEGRSSEMPKHFKNLELYPEEKKPQQQSPQSQPQPPSSSKSPKMSPEDEWIALRPGDGTWGPWNNINTDVKYGVENRSLSDLQNLARNKGIPTAENEEDQAANFKFYFWNKKDQLASGEVTNFFKSVGNVATPEDEKEIQQLKDQLQAIRNSGTDTTLIGSMTVINDLKATFYKLETLLAKYNRLSQRPTFFDVLLAKF